MKHSHVIILVNLIFINPLGKIAISATLFEKGIEMVFNISFAQKIQIMYCKWYKPIFRKLQSTLNFTFGHFRPSLGKCGAKNKIVCLRWILERRNFLICWIDRDFHFFCFRPEVPSLGKLCPKSQNSLF